MSLKYIPKGVGGSSEWDVRTGKLQRSLPSSKFCLEVIWSFLIILKFSNKLYWTTTSPYPPSPINHILALYQNIPKVVLQLKRNLIGILISKFTVHCHFIIIIYDCRNYNFLWTIWLFSLWNCFLWICAIVNVSTDKSIYILLYLVKRYS